MMANLFFIFDPSNFYLINLNWIMMLILIFIFPNSYWLIYSRYEMILMKFNNWIYNEFKMIMKQKHILIMFISFMLMIMIVNFTGLFPYIFTSTSHLTFTLSFSLSLWLMLMIYGWMNFYEDMMAHMLPLSTPKALMPFMILIETISNIIRPVTLSVRLTANMIAGHMLLALMGSTGTKINIILLLIMLTAQILLLMLEMAVSMIQSYVFSVLGTLYSTEI